MIALREEVQPARTLATYQHLQPLHRSIPFREQMSRKYWSVASRRRTLTNTATCFRLQAAMLPLQCQAAIEQLDELRQRVSQMETFLDTLDPTVTQRLRPYGCICLLSHLDHLLAEAIVTIAMFQPICQAVTMQRVELHLHSRMLFPRLLATFEDTVSQLAALMSQERQEVLQ